MTAKGWLKKEYERACKRSASVPDHARPAITGAARMSDEIDQIKANPRAYFESLPRPERLNKKGTE